jgi:hypothetical protein
MIADRRRPERGEKGREIQMINWKVESWDRYRSKPYDVAVPTFRSWDGKRL